MTRLYVALIAVVFGLAGCADRSDHPPLETRADSLAMSTYESMGGVEAWRALPYLQFDFGMEQDGERQVFRHHLWNRETGDYRVEWSRGDSMFVVLFDVDDRAGDAFVNSEVVRDTSQQRMLLDEAYRSYINDTYWLLAPIKMLDAGVQRSYEADSSEAGTEVVRLTFDQVGLTPGDTYWMYIDDETGRVQRWTFRLQGGNEGRFRWTGYQGFDTAAGSLYVATRKEAIGGRNVMLTDNVAMPRSVPDTMFTSPRPLLTSE